MLNSLRGSPVLSILFCIDFVLGPMMIVLREDIFPPNEDEPIPFSIQYLVFCAFIPSTVISLACTLITLYSVKFIELVSSSLKVLIGILITIVLDIASRYIAWQFFELQVAESGPVSILVFLYLLQILLFPNVNSPFIGTGEKYILGILLVIMIFLSGITAIIPAICGFVVYLFFAPMYCPKHEKIE